jgi:hypothetical protein
MSTTFTAEAIALDVDLYEATKDRQGKRRVSPSLLEETREVTLLKAIHEVLQSIAFYNTGRPGRPKITKIPRPKTAADIAARQRAWRTHQEIEAALHFVPREEFDRMVAERRG